LRFTPPRESQQRLRKMRARGKPVRWSKLQEQPEYVQAKALIQSTLG
jgi:beta-N-acetylhexosaminidase